MSDEASINASLQIIQGGLNYRSYPVAFKSNVTGALGPTPGAFTASTEGTDVDLSELVVPGLCEIRNLDETNFVEVGVWDGAAFYPFMEVGPEEHYVFKLSRNLNNEYGTGTATTDSGNTLRVKADTADCAVFVGAFEA